MRGVMKIMKKLPPFFAVPTTAGTGSETTLAAVVSNPKTHEKNACNDPVLRPKYAVLDPELTVGLPPHITSTTGMDALTHAVEAYTSKKASPITDMYALSAIKRIFDNIEIGLLLLIISCVIAISFIIASRSNVNFIIFSLFLINYEFI